MRVLGSGITGLHKMPQKSQARFARRHDPLKEPAFATRSNRKIPPARFARRDAFLKGIPFLARPRPGNLPGARNDGGGREM